MVLVRGSLDQSDYRDERCLKHAECRLEMEAAHSEIHSEGPYLKRGIEVVRFTKMGPSEDETVRSSMQYLHLGCLIVMREESQRKVEKCSKFVIQIRKLCMSQVEIKQLCTFNINP
jgi:hypothetical protein